MRRIYSSSPGNYVIISQQRQAVIPPLRYITVQEEGKQKEKTSSFSAPVLFDIHE